MKKVLFILFLLPLISKAQTYQSMPQAGYGPVKRMLFDSVLTVPLTITSLRNISGGRDTGQLRYNKSDSSLYAYTGYGWEKQKAAGGGGSQNLSQVLTVGNTAQDKTIKLWNGNIDERYLQISPTQLIIANEGAETFNLQDNKSLTINNAGNGKIFAVDLSDAATSTLDIEGNIKFRTGATNGYVLTSDVDGNATWQSSGGGITTFQVLSDVDTTLTNVQASYLFKEISAARTITLPATPTDGLEIQITSYWNNASNKVLTIMPNSCDIEGETGGYTIEPKGTIKLKYSDTYASWAIITEKL